MKKCIVCEKEVDQPETRMVIGFEQLVAEDDRWLEDYTDYITQTRSNGKEYFYDDETPVVCLTCCLNAIIATRQPMEEVWKEYTVACIEKAKQRLREHPDRSWYPHRFYTEDYLYKRLLGEVDEFTESRNPEELLDVGNFACWLWRKMTDGSIR